MCHRGRYREALRPLFSVSHLLVRGCTLLCPVDLIEHAAWATSATSLRHVDKFGDKFVSAFLTPGNYKLLLVHEGRNEESIKSFFLEVHELLVKYLLNPFSEYDEPITSAAFDKRVRHLSKRL